MVQKKKEKEEEEEEEKEKEKEKGRRPWTVVRELRSTVLQREQWRHGAEEEEEGEGEEREGEGEGLIIPLLQGTPLFTVL
jgi:hypothetical protein